MMQKWLGNKVQQTVECRLHAKLDQSMMLDLVTSQNFEGFVDQDLIKEIVFQVYWVGEWLDLILFHPQIFQIWF
jgi:hypothetical protein